MSDHSVDGRRSRVLMLLGNNPYPQDPRVRNEARALHSAGHEVTVLAPRDPGQRRQETVDGIRVVRYPAPFRGRSAVSQVLDHLGVAVATLAASIVISLRSRFDVVHVHNPPDTLGLVAALWQLRARRFVFDHHDLAGEMYRAQSDPPGRHRVVGTALDALERFCLRRADLVIATNTSYRDAEIEEFGVSPGRVAIVRNGPDLERFARREAPDLDRSSSMRLVCYAGVIGIQDGVDELVRAMHHVIHDLDRRDVRCVVVGDGDGLEQVRSLAAELAVGPWVEFTGRLTYDELVERLLLADLCVEPAPSNPYNDRSTAIKVMEYLAAGRPVVAYDLPEHRRTGGDVVQYVEANSAERLGAAIVDLLDDPVRRRARARAGRERVEQCLAWHHQAPVLRTAYERLSVESG